MENDNSYPRLRVLIQKQIVSSSRRSPPRDIVQSRPLREMFKIVGRFVTTGKAVINDLNHLKVNSTVGCGVVPPVYV